MSDWEYDQYTGAEWKKDLELWFRSGRDGYFKLDSNGELTVGCEDYGYGCGGSVSMNEQFGRLTLEQAIELSSYLNCVMIPSLMEKEKENESRNNN